MKNLESAIQDLEAIITSKAKSANLPYKRGNTIRVGKMLIRPSKKHGYIIFDVEQNTSVQTANSLRGALALANAYIKQTPALTIIEHDKKIEKYQNDCRFYKHGLNNATSDFKKDMFEIRLQDAEYNLQQSKDVLDNFIWKQIR